MMEVICSRLIYKSVDETRSSFENFINSFSA